MQEKRAADILITISLMVGITTLILGRTCLWSTDGIILIPSRAYGLLTSFILFAGGAYLCRLKLHTVNLSPFIIGIFGVIIFFSDWIVRGFSFIQGPEIRGEIFFLSLLGAVLIYNNNSLKLILKLLPFIVSTLLISIFLIQSKGKLLFADDQSVFFYRLNLLKEHFPFIPFFNPLWNSGIDSRDFFASGSLNIFLLFSPLIYLFDLNNLYNFIIVTILFILTPISTYFASKILNLEKEKCCIAAVLTMCTGLTWYRWGIKYGTLGFITSTALYPLIVAITLKYIQESASLTWRFVIFSIVAITLFLMWSPAGIAILPCILYAVVRIKSLIKYKKIIATILALIVLNLPWMAMFWSVSKVSNFVQVEKTLSGEKNQIFRHQSSLPTIKKTFKNFAETAVSSNPILIALGFSGIFLLNRKTKYIFIALSSWLTLLGAVLVSLKPQMELDRMLVVLNFLLTIPASITLCKILEYKTTGIYKYVHTLTSALILGFYFISPFSSATVVANRSVEKFSFAQNDVNEIVKIINQEKRTAGRFLFTGCVLHELSGGHLAPLVTWTKAPLIASSYVHNIWTYTQPIPEEFIKEKEAGINNYLNANNVTDLFAHERYWIDYLNNHPDDFEIIWKGERFNLFRRKNYINNYFLEGAGSNVNQSTNFFEFVPSTENLIIKLNYFPFLEVNNCQISPYKNQSLTLVKLTNCKIGQPVRIKMTNPLQRIING